MTEQSEYVTWDCRVISVSPETLKRVEGRLSRDYQDPDDQILFDVLVLVIDGWSTECAMRKAGFVDYYSSRKKLKLRPLYLEAREIVEQRRSHRKALYPRKNYSRLKRLRLEKERAPDFSEAPRDQQ